MEARGLMQQAAAASPLAVPGARALSSDSEDGSASAGFPHGGAGDGAGSPDSPLGSPLASPRLDKPSALGTLAAQLDAVASGAARAERAALAPAEEGASARLRPPDGGDEFASLDSSLRSASPAAVSACSSPDEALEDAAEELLEPSGEASPRAPEPRPRARPAGGAAPPPSVGVAPPWQRTPGRPPLGAARGVALLQRWGAAAAADDDEEETDDYGFDADAERERASVASTPSAASKQRAVAEWVESTSPLTQPRLSAGEPDASPPWGDALGWGGAEGVRHAPASPAGWGAREQVLRSPRRSPARRRGSRDRGARSLAEGDAAAALGRLLDDVADVKRALLSPAEDAPARRSPLPPPPAGSAAPPSPRVRASPDRPGVLPPEAWLVSRRATPTRLQAASDTPSPRSGTRRSALLLQLDGPAPAELEGFSFPAEGNRPASPELWRPGDSPSSAAQHAPSRHRSRHGRAGSERSDTEASAPSEMGSEMDSFRLGGRRAPAARPGSAAGSALLSEDHRAGGSSDWWRETIPEEEAFDGAEPGSVQWEQRRAALAERRVVALEQALEDAVSSAEEAGWEREALVARTAEAEAAAAAAQARADGAAARAAAELQSGEYVRRLLSRAEQLRDAARAEARQLRARLVARDGELRAAMDALDVRDEEAVTLRTRLRSERARAASLEAARAEAQAALAAAYARGLLLHRVLGMALAACVLMALRLMLGTRHA